MMKKIVGTVFLLLTLLAGSAMAATYVSVATGNWSATGTWAALKTGTITTSTGSTTVTGSGTLFTTELANGQKLYTASGVLIGTIASRASDTALTLTANAASSNTGSACYGTATATPTTADTATLSSPYTVTLDNSYTITTLVISSGATLSSTNQSTLTVSGNITNNGTFTSTNTSILQSTGNSAVISGSGTFSGSARLYTAGTGPSIAAGSSLTFAGTAVLRAGRNGGSTVSGSVLTINGTLLSTQTAGTNFLRLYASSTIIGSTGVINAPNSTISYNGSSATLTNNGTVTVQKITQNSTSNKWTQGANSNLTVSLTSTVGTLYASATGNTVTYNGTSGTDAPIATLNPTNTYYNLAGTAIICPTIFTILGTSPCGNLISQTRSPTSCVNVTGIGTIAWATPGNATASDNVYTTAANVIRSTTTNYLRCTGYGFTIPAGSVINGILVNVERKTNGGTLRDAAMRTVKDVGGTATIQGTDRSSANNYTTSDVIESHGGATDLWGGIWTVTDINAANFGAAFAAYNTSTTSTTNRTISVDHMPITVVYTPSSGPDHISVSAANVGSTCGPTAVTFTLHDTSHNRVSGWTGTLSLTTSDNKGDWSVVTGAGTLNNGTANDGAASYTFAAAENSITLNLTHTTTGTITIGVANGATNMLSKTPANELANSITYPNGGSFSIVSNASGTPAVVTSMNQTAGQNSPVYYLYAVNSACTAAFNNVTQTVQFASECNDPVSCQNAPAVVSITPYNSGGTTPGTAVALQKGLPNGTSSPTAGQYTNVSLNFNANSRAPFTLSYADVGRITLYMNNTSGGNTIFSESNPFVVAPAGFVLSGIKRTSDNFANPGATDATGAAFIKAGSPFSMTVTALTASGKAKADAGTAVNCATTSTDCTPNFGQEVSKESIALTPTLAAGLGLTNPGTVSGSFGAFSGGSASGTTFSWDEVGILTLAPHIAPDVFSVSSYLDAGDVTGTTSGKIGRFYPDHFSLTPDPNAPIDNRDDLNLCSQGLLVADGATPCVPAAQCVGGVLVSDGVTACVVAPAFNYMGERMALNFTLIAQNAGNAATQNYVYSSTAANNFAKLNPLASGSSLGFGAVDTTATTNLTSRVDTSLVSTGGSGSFSGGNALISAPIAITRSTSADGPYVALNLGIAPADSDGVAIGTYDLDTNGDGINDHALIGSTEVRYGRMRIPNAAGSPQLALPLTLTAQYWDSTAGAYVTSAGDSDTVLALTDIALGNYQGGAWTTAVTSPLANGGKAAGGIWPIILSKPVGLSGKGNVDVTLSNAAACYAYLPPITGHATFGIYTGNRNFIYQRENY
ncbi:MAG: hypothetical protein HY306_12385 [Nitrosomonadales bacterium]|nr:hypothetical protein [Nitrosomonadales bacterium]